MDTENREEKAKIYGMNPIHSIRIEALHAAVRLHANVDKIDQVEICILAQEFAQWIADGTIPDEPASLISMKDH